MLLYLLQQDIGPDIVSVTVCVVWDDDDERKEEGETHCWLIA